MLSSSSKLTAFEIGADFGFLDGELLTGIFTASGCLIKTSFWFLFVTPLSVRQTKLKTLSVFRIVTISKRELTKKYKESCYSYLAESSACQAFLLFECT